MGRASALPAFTNPIALRRLILRCLCALLVVNSLSFPAHADMTARQAIAMVEAAERGDVSQINRLLIVGVPVDARDELGRTGLLATVEHGRLEAFKVLLTEGADINAVARNLDTPWLLAGALGRAEMLRLMIPKQPDLGLRNRFGGTALIPACERGHVEAVKVLLTTKIDLDHVNNLGWTCLIEIALLGSDGARHLEVARLVLAAGANPNIADRRGATPLQLARSRGLQHLARTLTAAGGR